MKVARSFEILDPEDCPEGWARAPAEVLEEGLFEEARREAEAWVS